MQARQHLRLLAQDPCKTVALELGRPQPQDQRTQLLERLARELAHPRNLRAGGIVVGGLAIEQGRGSLGGEDETEQLLAHDVVELECEAVALGDDRELAAAFVQARVGDGDRGVGREQLDQRLVGWVECPEPRFSVR